MKKVFYLLVLALFAGAVFGQEIKVIDEGDKEPTKLVFKTTNGKQVPIYRPMGQMDFDQGNEKVILKKVQLIGSAPLSLEVEQGHYTFSLYENGPIFNIDAQGGTQEWMIKPGSNKYWMFGTGAMFAGMATLGSGMWLGFESDTSSPFYDENNHQAAMIALGVTATTTVVAAILWLINKPSVKRVN